MSSFITYMHPRTQDFLLSIGTSEMSAIPTFPTVNLRKKKTSEKNLARKISLWAHLLLAEDACGLKPTLAVQQSLR